MAFEKIWPNIIIDQLTKFREGDEKSGIRGRDRGPVSERGKVGGTHRAQSCI